MIKVETSDGKIHEIPVIDYHVHVWKANEENWLRPELASKGLDRLFL